MKSARLVVVLGIPLLVEATSLELLDLLGDASLALFESELLDLVLQTLRPPVLGLFGGLEFGILTDGSMSIRIDLLDIIRANAIGKVSRELLLEPVIPKSELRATDKCQTTDLSSSSSSKLSIYSAT